MVCKRIYTMFWALSEPEWKKEKKPFVVNAIKLFVIIKKNGGRITQSDSQYYKKVTRSASWITNAVQMRERIMNNDEENKNAVDFSELGQSDFVVALTLLLFALLLNITIYKASMFRYRRFSFYLYHCFLHSFESQCAICAWMVHRTITRR